MYPSLLNYIFIATSALGFLIVFLLLFVSKADRRPSHLLAGVIFFLAFLLFHLTLFHTGDLIHFPHFFRLPSPTSYLIAPLAFLYVRAVLKKDTRFRKYDWIFFLPFVMHTLELIPFFLKSASEKQAILEQYHEHSEFFPQLDEGLLPPYLHSILKTGIGLIFMFFIWRMLYLYCRNLGPDCTKRAGQLMGWLAVFTASITILGILVLVSSLLHKFMVNPQLLHTASIAFLFLVLLFILLIRPGILYGVDINAGEREGSEPSEENREEESQDGALILSEDQMNEYIELIEKHLSARHSYLRQRFSLPELAKETGIPRHHLSATINRGMGMNFNELINWYRIQYIVEHFDEEVWETLSIDGVGREVGFRTRSTFLKAFKQNTGMNPSEFRKRLLAD